MQLLGDLGIDIKLLLAQVVNFGILLWLLTKFLYKPIIKRIEKDEQELNQAQKQKEQLIQEKIILEQQKTAEIAQAKEQSQKIIKEAEDIAKKIKKRSQEEAELEKQAVIKQIQARLSEIDNAKTSQEQSR